MGILSDFLLPFLVILGILVFIHELGHHLAAKLFGMKVDAFSLGFPPRAWGFRWATGRLRAKFQRDIRTVIFSNPAFVSIDQKLQADKVSGSAEESLTWLAKSFRVEQSETKIQVLNRKNKPDERIEIETTVVPLRASEAETATILPLISGDADLTDELLKYQEIQDDAVYHTKFKTDYCLSWIPLGGYCKINGMVDESLDEQSFNEGKPKPWEYRAKPVWQRMIVISAGVTFNMILAGVVFVLMALSQGVPDESKYEQLKTEKFSPKIGVINPGGPADRAGLEAGDVITAINGTPVTEWQNLVALIRKCPDQTITVSWKRGEEAMSAEVKTMSVKIPKGDGDETIGQIGIGPDYPDYSREASFGEAVGYGARRLIFTTALIGFSLKQVLFGEVSAKEALGGPIMIVKTTGDVKRQQGWSGIWNLMALLSISLAIFNLFPIPALDGGHLLILFIEAVIRKPLSLKFKIYAQQVGMAILLTLIVYIFFNDIMRLAS